MREDLEIAIKRSKSSFLLQKGALKKIEGILKENEDVLFVVSVNMTLVVSDVYGNINPMNKRPGVFVITTKRVLHYFKALLDDKYEQISVGDIDSVEFGKKNIMSSVLRISAINKIMDLDMSSENGKLALNIFDNLINNRNSVNPDIIPTINSQGIKDKIKDLKLLLDEGLINNEEFDRKKQELLNTL